MNTDIRDTICEMGYGEAVVFDGPDYDEAIVGVTDDARVVYDYDKMVRCLMDEYGIDYAAAEDFISCNTIRVMGFIDNPPIIMYPIKEDTL